MPKGIAGIRVSPESVMAFDISTEPEGHTRRRPGYGLATNCAIFDLDQEYCAPDTVSDCRAIFSGRGRGAAGIVLPKPKLSERSFADFGGGGHFGIKRAALGDIITLRRVRKSKARDEADRKAAANRASFGRTRAERERDERERKQLSDVLNQHRIEDESRR
jgi:hypothetical protein